MSTDYGPLFANVPEVDICAHKHHGVRTSEAAFERGKAGHAAMRERVRIFVHGCGFQGCTLRDIVKAFGVEKNAVSGRISQLLAGGEIFDSKRDKVDNFRIYVGRKEWCNGSAQ